MSKKITNSAKVVARTVEGIVTDIPTMNKEMTCFSGRAAGVCYMADSYSRICEQGDARALSRADGNAHNGHHSVYDHPHISLELNITKAMAMILNSLGVYSTSEKSARYTVMAPETEIENEMYQKWIQKIQKLILDKYPDYDDTAIKSGIEKEIMQESNWKFAVCSGQVVLMSPKDGIYGIDKVNERLNEIAKVIKCRQSMPSYKLAMENARYMISVFTPTTMIYTISFRQAMLTIDYLKKLSADCDKLSAKNIFFKKLKEHCDSVAIVLEENIGELRLKDIKNQKIRVFDNCIYSEASDKEECIGDSYTLRYTGSLAMFAQAQRHRTLRYSMFIPNDGDRKYFIPPIVKEAGLGDEWTTDIQKVDYCVPQGTLVDITEQGIFEDFALKCKERLCGRAQLEIAISTSESVRKFVDNKDKLCTYNRGLLGNIIENDVAVPRCGFEDFKCTEGCRWGIKHGLDRLI